jgi:hypothetical protein
MLVVVVVVMLLNWLKNVWFSILVKNLFPVGIIV